MSGARSARGAGEIRPGSPAPSARSANVPSALKKNASPAGPRDQACPAGAADEGVTPGAPAALAILRDSCFAESSAACKTLEGVPKVRQSAPELLSVPVRQRRNPYQPEGLCKDVRLRRKTAVPAVRAGGPPACRAWRRQAGSLSAVTGEDACLPSPTDLFHRLRFSTRSFGGAFPICLRPASDTRRVEG